MGLRLRLQKLLRQYAVLRMLSAISIVIFAAGGVLFLFSIWHHLQLSKLDKLERLRWSR